MSDPTLNQRIADPLIAECPSCGQVYEVRWLRADTNEPVLPTCGRCHEPFVLSQRKWRWELAWKQDGVNLRTTGRWVPVEAGHE